MVAQLSRLHPSHIREVECDLCSVGVREVNDEMFRLFPEDNGSMFIGVAPAFISATGKLLSEIQPATG